MQLTEIELSELTGRPEDVRAVQKVFHAAPSYLKLISGGTAPSNAASRMFSTRPPGQSSADKRILGIKQSDALIGCIYFVRGYPNLDTTFIGLLLLAESHEGRGLGTKAYQALETLIRGWTECTKIQLNVIASNRRALRFWNAQGFTRTGAVSPYQHASVTSQTVLFSKQINHGRASHKAAPNNEAAPIA